MSLPPYGSRTNGARRFAHLLSQANTASACVAGGPLTNELDACGIEGADELHQGIDIAANHAFAGFHALDCGH
jgi:hypothetical protein